MSSDSTPIPRWQIVVSWILSCLPLAAFLPSAYFKIAQPGDFLANWTKDFPAATARPIGIIELAVVILYLNRSTSVLGAILVTGYLGGAVCVHVGKGEPAAFIPFVIGVMYWGALFLRDRRLRALLPITKKD